MREGGPTVGPDHDAPRSQRASDRIVEQLRELIRTNQLRAGETLSQVGLAKQFGVSRIPVREALRQLAAEGFVVWEPGEMVVVAEFGRALVEEVIEVRTVLERWLVDRAVDRLDSGAIDELDRLTAEMAGARDPVTWRRHNDRFHHVIQRAASSLIAGDLVDRLGAHADRFLDVPVDVDAAGRKRADSEHCEIVRALRAGDPGRARTLLHDHLGHRLDRLAELLDGFEH